MKEQPAPATIESVELQFESWRSLRTRKLEPIPAELWDAAVSLCNTHPITHVCRRLRLSYPQLKKRLVPTPRFVELTPGSLFTQWQLVCERADGARLHVSATGPVPELDGLLGRFLS